MGFLFYISLFSLHPFFLFRPCRKGGIMQEPGKDIRFISYYLGRGRRKTMKVVRGSPEERTILNHNADLRREERHQKKELSLNQITSKGIQVEAETDNTEDERIGVIKPLIGLLPEKQKVAFEMALLNHLTEREIAERLHISKNAVHCRLQNAVKNLRFLIADKTHHCKSH